jgi:hypothetical protein
MRNAKRVISCFLRAKIAFPMAGWLDSGGVAASGNSKAVAEERGRGSRQRESLSRV